MKIYTCISQLLLVAVTGLKLQEISESCTKNSDCTTKNSICSDGQCTCDNISLNSGTGCLPYVTEYKAYCEIKEQCEWLGSNYDCIENKCSCMKTYTWYQGSCQQLVDKGSPCKSNTDCYNRNDILSLQCSDGKCSCADDYYDRGPDCRKISSKGNSCAIDEDCNSTNLSCTLGRCSDTPVNHLEEAADYSFSGSRTRRKLNVNVSGNISCIFDNDCQDMANSFCQLSTGTCVCDENTRYLHEGNCLPGFGPCSEEKDCAQQINTMCFKNSCVCSRGFFLHEGNCIAELGMPDLSLKSVDDCLIKPGQLVRRESDSTCVCKTYWFNDDMNRNCIKTMIQDVSSCLTNEWCDAMGPYSFCNSKTKKCQCSSFAKLNETNYYCVKNNDPQGACLRNSNCKLNEECVDEKCQCIENYSKHGNVCLPDIGETCDEALCAHIDDSGCSQGVCQCYSNYIGKGSKCYKVASKLNDSCDIQEQCQNIKYSQCGPENSGNKTCICREGYVMIDDYCLKTKEYGDPCMKHTDCTLVLNHSLECRNSKCQCPIGSKMKNGYCISSSTKYSLTVSLLVLSLLSLCMNI